jgi:hypothetical protein
MRDSHAEDVKMGFSSPFLIGVCLVFGYLLDSRREPIIRGARHIGNGRASVRMA